MALNLEKQLCFYGQYHHNTVNVAIHMICVPIILITGFTVLSNTGTLIPLPSYLTIPNLPLNGATICAIIYSVFYILLEPIAGSMVVPILLGATAYGNHLYSIDPSGTTKGALIIHGVSWILQFIGHGAFEGRAPALLDNLFQAIFLAPFFVWMEVLFKFGYRPELQSRVEKEVEKEIQKFNGGKDAKNGKAQ